MADLQVPPTQLSTDTNSTIDLIVWKELKEGNKQTLEFIYNSNIKMMLHYGLKIIRNEEQVADIIQDLFIEIWETRGRLADVKSIKLYLLKSLKYKLLRKVLNQKRLSVQNEIPLDYNFEINLSRESELILLENSKTKYNKLQKALNELTPKQKEIIYLRFYNNLSYDEISSIMSISIQGSYNLLSKALKFLHQSIVHFSLLLFFVNRV